MDVRVTEEQSEKCESDPRKRIRRECFESSEKDNSPQLGDDANIDTDIPFDFFTQPSPKQELIVRNHCNICDDTCSIMRTVEGIVSKFVWNVLKPILRSVRVR